MIEEADFTELVARAMALPGRAHMRPVVEKELLHYDILYTLDREGLLDTLTFQGGTSLRLCHGSPRFSEDLVFVGGREFTGAQLMEMRSCVEHYIGRRYHLEATVREPAELKHEREHEDKFYDFLLSEIRGLLEEARNGLSLRGSEGDFRI